MRDVAAEYRTAERIEAPTPLVTVFGSAQPQPGDPVYESAAEVGYELALAGYSVITGGGEGVMSAAPAGHQAARCWNPIPGWAVGAQLTGLDGAHRACPYLDKVYIFDNFPARKRALMQHSVGFVVMPGGFGTLDELFEVVTLMQTGKADRRPVVLVGYDYWYPLLEFLHHRLCLEGMISREDEGLISLADYGEELRVVEFIHDRVDQGGGG